jgi:hypothetical protein
MSQTNNDKKPVVDKSLLDKSIKDKEKVIKNNQTVKK